MTKYYTNFFAVRNPEELECTARVFRVEGLPKVELEKNLNIIRTKVRQACHYPAAILWSKREPRIAVHADARGVEGVYQLVPSVANLVDAQEEITIRFDRVADKAEPIATEFLDWYVRGAFMHKTWGAGKKHFPLKPDNLGNALRYRGFSLDTKYVLPPKAFCLVVDITHRYCDAVNLGARLESGEEDLLGMGKTYLYHFGKRRYLVHAIDVSGYPASETQFAMKDGVVHDVYSYTVDVCKRDRVDVDFSPDDPGIVYRYPGRKDTEVGISTLCHRTLRTDDPDVSIIHDESILEPTERYDLIEGIKHDYLSRLSFNGTPILLEDEPILDAPAVSHRFLFLHISWLFEHRPLKP